LNTERVALINMALDGVVSLEEVAPLLNALAALEAGDDLEETVIVEPPCRPPSWLEAGEDLLQSLMDDRFHAALHTATREIPLALQARDRGALTRRISALDLMAMFGYAPMSRTHYMSGGLELVKEEGRLRMRAVNIVTSWSNDHQADLPMAHWLLLPGSLPVQSMEASERREVDHDDWKRVLTASTPDTTVETPLGAFPDCLRVDGETVLPDEPEGRPLDERIRHFTLWLAKGIGPVRMEAGHYDGVQTIGELVSYSTQESAEYFPLDFGNFWQFGVRTGEKRFQEVWRALSPNNAGVWLSTAASSLPQTEAAL
jgi:hypothetical protein